MDKQIGRNQAQRGRREMNAGYYWFTTLFYFILFLNFVGSFRLIIISWNILEDGSVQRRRNALQRGQEGHDDRSANRPDRKDGDECRKDGYTTRVNVEAEGYERNSKREQGSGRERSGNCADEDKPGAKLDDDGTEGWDVGHKLDAVRAEGNQYSSEDGLLVILELYSLYTYWEIIWDNLFDWLISGMGVCLCPEDGYLYEEGRRDLMVGRQDL